jgi:CubicO group peptidase (beta-lactamase class C family)
MAVTRSLMEDVAAWADGWLAHRQQTLGIPGLQFAIAHEGSVLLSSAHGRADLTSGEALTSDHLFCIASHSKTFTATAIMQLADEPVPAVRLDDRLSSHLGWLVDDPATARLANLTVEELLCHGGGVIRDGTDGDCWQLRRSFPDTAELRKLLTRGPSPFAANERFHYSNVAYSLLGCVIEAVTGHGYAEHLREAIIAPLGLVDTDPDFVEERAALYAAGHTHNCSGAPRIPIDPVSTNAMAPATGFTSTAEDLVQFFGALCFGDERVISDAAKRRMQLPRWTQHGNEHYGLGLQILDIGERRVIGHSGGYPGHSTKTWCDPRDAIVVSVLGNAIDAPAAELGTGIFRLIDRVARRDGVIPTHAPGCQPRSFAGRFANLWGMYDIAAFGDRLLYVPLGSNDPAEVAGELAVEDGATAMLVRARDGYESEGERFVFERDAAGEIVRVRGTSSMSAYPEEEYARRFLSAPRVQLRP